MVDHRNFRRLEPDEIVSTIDKLRERIAADFGDRGLTRICGELGQVARDAKRRIAQLERTNWGLYLLPALVSVLIGYLSAAMLGNVDQALANLTDSQLRADFKQLADDLKRVFEHIKLPIVLAVPLPLVIGIFVSMWTLDSRWKRRRSLRYLHELRSIIHVIDMHHLSKLPHGLPVESDGALEGDKLRRYLSYCADMLSISSKIAALYAESTEDSIVIETVNNLGQTTANLGNKIWQRLDIVEAAAGASRPFASPVRERF